MNKSPLPDLPNIAAWDHVMQFDQTMSLTAARALLKLQFTEPDTHRMQDLAAKARQGELSASETLEIGTFEQLGCLLDILHSKARRRLKLRKVKSG